MGKSKKHSTKARKTGGGRSNKQAKFMNKQKAKLAKQKKLLKVRRKAQRLAGTAPSLTEEILGEDFALPLDMITDTLDSDDSSETDAEIDNSVRQHDMDSMEIEEYKRNNVTSGDTKDENLLPVKLPSGEVILRTVSPDALDPGENPEPTADEEPSITCCPPVVQLFAQRQDLLQEHKSRIASLCEAIVTDPYEHILKLKELVALMKAKSDPIIRQTIQKLAVVSLCELFLDVIPGYTIKPLTEKQQQESVKKETKKLRNFESILIKSYKDFVEFLLRMAKGGGKGEVGVASSPSHWVQLAVTCASKLLVRHPHFNFNERLIKIVCHAGLGSRSDNLRSTAFAATEELFQTDPSGETSLLMVKCINQYIREHKRLWEVSPQVVQVFLALPISEVEKKDPQGLSVKEKLKQRKEKLQKMSRRERKRQKQLDQLDKELRDLEIDEVRQGKLKLHTEILSQVFNVYFRLLDTSVKSANNDEIAHLLPPVLSGMSRFGHLVNVEFFDDLFRTLGKLLCVGELRVLDQLHCVKTVFTLLAMEHEVLNVDPYLFYKHLYGLMPAVFSEADAKLFNEKLRLLFVCLHLMLNKRKNAISLPRVAAFAKRLLLHSVNFESKAAVLASIGALGSYFISHPKLDIVFDFESFGTGKYLPEIDDPDHCGALSCKFTEIRFLLAHYDADVRRFAKDLLQGVLSPARAFSVIKLDPLTVLDQYSV